MFISLNAKQVINNEDIVIILNTHNRKKKTAIITKDGRKYLTKKTVSSIVKSITSYNGLIK